MSTLLREVIAIPERAGAEDYVLRLTDSVAAGRVAQTLDEYVVTPELVESFDGALGLVADALAGGISRGAFLTGSFGSGKSHFMAVLHALLRGEPAARGKAELQPVIAEHDKALRGRTVLPLVFHLLGASSFEEAVFSGYLRQISALHPGAPLPAVHKSDALLADADKQRERMGDDRFFAELNGSTGDSGTDEWSGLLGAGTWNAQTYNEARTAAPSTRSRQELVSALTQTFFTSYTRQADFVDLDDGLAAISRHAHGLGYDAVVLFLDELVLWLAFAIQDREFFRRESQKITKLVESGVGNRPIPLVSFVARQMDLRRWFADTGASGVEQEALDRVFRHQEGRFSRIELGDDNLPYVANQRLLRPKDDEAEALLNDAFRRLDRRPDVWDVLLDGINTDEQHRGADETAFRRTYPFSPALVSTLRSLASVMQRERTALKVMQQILVDRRDTLTVDDVIPVGDAFDYVVQGQSGQALDPNYAAMFRAADALYTEKLRPILLQPYRITEEQLASGTPAPAGLLADERLAKTLLLSAVAPNVPALKGLTATRLASLNHGSIVTPLPGNEASMVTGKVREWARTVPEIHVASDAANPIIRVALADVDYESIVERSRGEDNEGRRRELIKDMVTEEMGVALTSPDAFGVHPHQIVWRGSRRHVDLLFGNVRDAGWITDGHFQARPRTWRVIVDFPFDTAGHSSAEDRERLDRLMSANVQEHTLVWLPAFFSDERMRDVSRLVVLNWLLEGTGEHWTTNADHLSESDRVSARAILESQRESLRHSLTRAIQVAYGAAAPTTAADDVRPDWPVDNILTSLDRGFAPRRPVGPTLQAAFTHLLSQAFDATYPGHPEFQPPDQEVKPRELKAVYQLIEEAMADPEHRVPLSGDIAAVRRITNALHVGHAAETHFLFDDGRFTEWGQQFARELGRRGDDSAPVTVKQARGWIEAMTPPKGLTDEVADLVILAWAALRQRAWYHYGAPVPTPAPGQLRDEMEMREQPMPTADEWSAGSQRAAKVFGVAAGRYLTPQAVTAVAEQVKSQATAWSQPAEALVRAVERALGALSANSDDAPRLAAAQATRDLCQQVRHLSNLDVVRRLAAVDLGADDVAGRSLSSAHDVAASLEQFAWGRLRPLQQAKDGEGPRADEASRILSTLLTALRADEFTDPIAPALDRAERDLFGWLDEGVRAEHRAKRDDHQHDDDNPPLDPITVAGRPAGTRKVGPTDDLAAVMADLDRFRQSHPDRRVVVEWRLDS